MSTSSRFAVDRVTFYAEKMTIYDVDPNFPKQTTTVVCANMGTCKSKATHDFIRSLPMCVPVLFLVARVSLGIALHAKYKDLGFAFYKDEGTGPSRRG